jgi:hypothetical protein
VLKSSRPQRQRSAQSIPAMYSISAPRILAQALCQRLTEISVIVSATVELGKEAIPASPTSTKSGASSNIAFEIVVFYRKWLTRSRF